MISYKIVSTPTQSKWTCSCYPRTTTSKVDPGAQAAGESLPETRSERPDLDSPDHASDSRSSYAVSHLEPYNSPEVGIEIATLEIDGDSQEPELQNMHWVNETHSKGCISYDEMKIVMLICCFCTSAFALTFLSMLVPKQT